jgi:phage terminase small subunit
MDNPVSKFIDGRSARVAGYSPKGAKQRGAFLMDQPKIRVRID